MDRWPNNQVTGAMIWCASESAAQLVAYHFAIGHFGSECARHGGRRTRCPRSTDGGRVVPTLGCAPCMLPGVHLLCVNSKALTASSAMFAGKRQVRLFFSGITPLLVFALFGSGMEAFKYSVCPVSESGVPLCFYSLALALSLLVAFFAMRACSNLEFPGPAPNTNQKDSLWSVECSSYSRLLQ